MPSPTAPTHPHTPMRAQVTLFRVHKHFITPEAHHYRYRYKLGDSAAFLTLYANGKSAVRVDAPGVRHLGPHFFTGEPSPRWVVCVGRVCGGVGWMGWEVSWPCPAPLPPPCWTAMPSPAQPGWHDCYTTRVLAFPPCLPRLQVADPGEPAGGVAGRSER